MTADKEAEDALAHLIACTRTRKRRAALTRIAQWLDVALGAYGNIAAVADRVALSPKMLRQFQSVSQLTPEVRGMFETRELDSVDMAAHLALLPPEEQLIVAKDAKCGRLDTSDVRAILQEWKQAESRDIQAIVRAVFQSKTKREYVAEFVSRGHMQDETVRAAFAEEIGDQNIVRIEKSGALGKLVMTKAGKARLLTAAKRRSLPMRAVIPAILADPRNA